MNKLTKREKNLLYFLLCFLIAIFGYMMVSKPTMEKYAALTEEYEMTQSKYRMMAGVTKEVENLLKQSDDLDKLIEEQMDNFYKVLLPEDIDRTAIDFFIRNGVVPVGLEMTDVSLQPVRPYDLPATVASGEADNTQIVFGTAYTCDVTYTFHGSQEQFEQILQAIDDAPQMQLISFTKAEPTEEIRSDDSDDEKINTNTIATLTGDDYTITMRLLMQNVNEDQPNEA